MIRFHNLSLGFPPQLGDREVQVQSTWEDITKMVKKTEVHKDDLKERSDAEIQRSGQPLCIYEPYHGEGAWAFLHDDNTLYRGVSLVSNLSLAFAIMSVEYGLIKLTSMDDNFTMYSVTRVLARWLISRSRLFGSSLGCP